MAKGYWISCYRNVKNADRFGEYAKLAPAAIQAAGGRFIVRGMADKVYEQGVKQRVVIVEFDSLAAAHSAHDGPAYQQALKVLGDAVERDFRIVEGV